MSIVHFGRKSRPSALLLKQRLTEEGYNGLDINFGYAPNNEGLNSPLAISQAVNKRQALEIMRENEVPTPSLFSAFVQGHAYYSPFGDVPIGIPGDVYPVVGRPDTHSQGRGYWLCNNDDDVKSAMRGRRHKAAATHFLQYIDGAREFRVHIMRDGREGRTDKYRSVKISEKLPTGEVDAVPLNHARGASTFNYTELNGHDRAMLRKAARGAVRALDLEFGAVDILLKDDKVYVLEVNTAPCLTDETSDTLEKYVTCFMRYWHTPITTT